MFDHAERLFKLEERQPRIGQDQIDVEFGCGKQQVAHRNGRHLEVHAQFALGHLPVGGLVGADALQELQHPQILPARADLEADVVVFTADRDREERHLALEVRHLGIEQADELVDLVEHARQRDQLVPVAGVGVVGLGQIDFIIRAHVAVDAAWLATRLMVIIEQHLIAERDFSQAIAALVVNPEIFAVAFFIGGGGRGHHDDIGGD